jgi:Skp family chaperone for outer membrane proteins
MEIRVINFEILTRHYKIYQDGIHHINNERKNFIQSIEPIRKEMNSFIALSTNGVIVDQKTQDDRNEKFQKLQNDLIEMDNEFKNLSKEMIDKLNIDSYDGLSKIINEWAIGSSIDMVTGSMEVVYLNPKFDSTNDILEILKEKDLFI